MNDNFWNGFQKIAISVGTALEAATKRIASSPKSSRVEKFLHGPVSQKIQKVIGDVAENRVQDKGLLRKATHDMIRIIQKRYPKG